MAAVKAKNKGKPTKISVDIIRASFEKQDAYTLNRPVRKRFAPNTYTVTNVMDKWECDLLDVQAFAK